MRVQFSAVSKPAPDFGPSDVCDTHKVLPQHPAVEMDGLEHQREIAAAIQRVMAHDLMRKSPKLQAFLTYVVDETLAGRGDRLKAYSIAIAALGKHTAFDPSLDPIVRVEASRLRRCLNAYYATDGKYDPLRILMPTGSYRPVFERMDQSADAVEFKPDSNESGDRHVKASAERHFPQTKSEDRSQDVYAGEPPKAFHGLPRLILVANLGMMIFTLIFGLKVMFDVDQINKRMERFQAYWNMHLTARMD